MDTNFELTLPVSFSPSKPGSRGIRGSCGHNRCLLTLVARDHWAGVAQDEATPVFGPWDNLTQAGFQFIEDCPQHFFAQSLQDLPCGFGLVLTGHGRR